MPSFEIPADIFTHLSVSELPEGSSNTFKTRKNVSLYFKRRHLIIDQYYIENKRFWNWKLHFKLEGANFVHKGLISR